MDITVSVETKHAVYPTTWEQSRAFRKLWKALNMPKAEFKSESFSGGDSLRVELLEPVTEIQKSIILELERFFEKGHFNGMEDIYEYKKNHREINPFSFKYVSINLLRG